MGLTVVNNVASMTGQHNLNRTNSALGKSLERLSSGLKINRGADGPAALVISEQQRAQITGLNQAVENAGKAVSMVQTGEGALNEINRLLLKARGLALDSANAGVNDADAMAANQSEISNILSTIDRIATNTQFGTKKLLDGSSGMNLYGAAPANVTFLRATGDTVAGSYATAVTTVGERGTLLGGAQAGALGADETLTINGVNITLQSGMTQNQVVSRINEFTNQTGVVAMDDSSDATKTRLYTQQFGSASSISVVSTGTGAGFTTSVQSDSGVDIVGTIGGTSFTGVGNVLTATAGPAKGLSVAISADGTDPYKTVTGALGSVTIEDKALVFQIGANAGQTAKIALQNVKSSALGIGVNGSQFQKLSDVDVTTASKATDALKVIDQAIDDVTTIRGTLGAFQQNTLEATANNLRTTLENTVSAESTIRDTDFASEIANFTKNQTLMQSGISVLSNANQVPQLVLSLLR